MSEIADKVRAASRPGAAAMPSTPNLRHKCKFCGTGLRSVVTDLGMQPLSNAILPADSPDGMEPFFPLLAMVCDSCFLVQAPDFETPDHIFSAQYPYFSSVSEQWLEHAKRFAEATRARFGLGAESRVVEIASNDGYLLRWFRDMGVPVLGIEPTDSTAKAAEALGIPVERRFFGREYAIELRKRGFAADLMPANNVVAHIPDIVDFVSGFRELLKPQGVASFEFHHLLNLIEKNQFDTIYHEHYYYHSLSTFKRILAHCGLAVFDVEELTTHGGSLRVYAQRADTGKHATTPAVPALLEREAKAGLTSLEGYVAYGERVKQTKRNILRFLIQAKDEGKRICAIGAPAKGNTLLNYLGIGTDFIDFTVEHTPHKQNHLLPGSHIPILAPEALVDARPDYVVILPWNWADEITRRMAVVRDWGGKFVTLIPEVRVF